MPCHGSASMDVYTAHPMLSLHTMMTYPAGLVNMVSLCVVPVLTTHSENTHHRDRVDVADVVDLRSLHLVHILSVPMACVFTLSSTMTSSTTMTGRTYSYGADTAPIRVSIRLPNWVRGCGLDDGTQGVLNICHIHSTQLGSYRMACAIP